jgi:hypothetical protein
MAGQRISGQTGQTRRLSVSWKAGFTRNMYMVPAARMAAINLSNQKLTRTARHVFPKAVRIPDQGRNRGEASEPSPRPRIVCCQPPLTAYGRDHAARMRGVGLWGVSGSPSLPRRSLLFSPIPAFPGMPAGPAVLAPVATSEYPQLVPVSRPRGGPSFRGEIQS